VQWIQCIIRSVNTNTELDLASIQTIEQTIGADFNALPISVKDYIYNTLDAMNRSQVLLLVFLNFPSLLIVLHVVPIQTDKVLFNLKKIRKVCSTLNIHRPSCPNLSSLVKISVDYLDDRNKRG
jgi:hypothetical protein